MEKYIEKYLDVMKRMVELSETCLEGMEHIKLQLNEGRFEDSIRLMTDVVEAYHRMEKSLQDFLSQLSPNRIEELSNPLRRAFEYVVSAYEEGEGAKALEIIQFNLLPSYKKWKGELERSLNPYLVS
jgi:hypothetical protein